MSVASIVKGWFAKRVVRMRLDGESCKTCRFVSDFSDTEPEDEVNAYCMHPFHLTRMSAHYGYGGHWTHTDSWCEMFERDDVATTAPK